jgi:thiamine-monophosphate kinase
MIDLSDGLVQDLMHLCVTDKLGADIYEANLPFSEALSSICQQKSSVLTNLALQGGEDYELLFTIRREDVKKLNKLFLKADTTVSHIGEITKSPGKIFLRQKNGRKKSLKSSIGFNHFKRDKWS